ncbi:hypothetical protein AB0D57_41375 [Streptomyces sp. NPDC048275]|uniref:hypothetical protein n=1 Tax=Streptomyces sp. NPDC048275 TaxID=3155629 RepID=UPI0033E66EA7
MSSSPSPSSSSSSPLEAARARLDAAVARVRFVFAGMRVLSQEPACPHCYTSDELALLRTPDAVLPDSLMRHFFHESPGLIDNFDEVVRRLLPQFAAYLAGGRFSGMGYAQSGLGRVDWRNWPRGQAEAIEEFIEAWWLDFLRDDSSPHAVADVLEVASDMAGRVTPLLALWAAEPRGGRADALLECFVESRLDDLLQDDPTVLGFWCDRQDLVAELQQWLVDHAVDRLTEYGTDDDTIIELLHLTLPRTSR